MSSPVAKSARESKTKPPHLPARRRFGRSKAARRGLVLCGFCNGLGARYGCPECGHVKSRRK